MSLPSNGDGPSNSFGLLLHFPMSSKLPSLFSFEVPFSNLLPFPMLPFPTLFSSDLLSSKLLFFELMHSFDLLHFFKL